jgi:hypothetical protein
MLYCQKKLTQRQEIGMNKKLLESHGVYARYKEMLIHNIIT